MVSSNVKNAVKDRASKKKIREKIAVKIRCGNKRYIDLGNGLGRRNKDVNLSISYN